MIDTPCQYLRIFLTGPFFHAVHKLPQRPLLYLCPFFKQPGCQHRSQGEGNKERKQGSKYDSQAELFEVLSYHIRHKSDRQKNDYVAQRNGNGGHADFHTAVEGCRLRRLSAPDMAVYIFQNNDGVVYEDTNAKSHPHERHHIKGKTGHIHGKKCRNKRCRYGYHNGQ